MAHYHFPNVLSHLILIAALQSIYSSVNNTEYIVQVSIIVEIGVDLTNVCVPLLDLTITGSVEGIKQNCILLEPV